MLIDICLIASVQWSPLWLIFEQSHSLDIVLAVRGEAVIDPSGQNDQIVLLKSDSHPVIGLAANIEETLAIKNVPDLFVLMEMLVEEHLHLLLVHCAHLVRADDDLISVLV